MIDDNTLIITREKRKRITNNSIIEHLEINNHMEELIILHCWYLKDITIHGSVKRLIIEDCNDLTKIRNSNKSIIENLYIHNCNHIVKWPFVQNMAIAYSPTLKFINNLKFTKVLTIIHCYQLEHLKNYGENIRLNLIGVSEKLLTKNIIKHIRRLFIHPNMTLLDIPYIPNLEEFNYRQVPEKYHLIPVYAKGHVDKKILRDLFNVL